MSTCKIALLTIEYLKYDRRIKWHVQLLFTVQRIYCNGPFTATFGISMGCGRAELSKLRILYLILPLKNLMMSVKSILLSKMISLKIQKEENVCFVIKVDKEVRKDQHA